MDRRYTNRHYQYTFTMYLTSDSYQKILRFENFNPGLEIFHITQTFKTPKYHQCLLTNLVRQDLSSWNVSQSAELVQPPLHTSFQTDAYKVHFNIFHFQPPCFPAVGCRTCDQQVVSSNPSLHAVGCNPGQVVNTHVPLSPNSSQHSSLAEVWLVYCCLMALSAHRLYRAITVG